MYTIDVEKAREAVAPSSKTAFDNIVEQRVLGASTHIQMIGDMIEQICIDEVLCGSTLTMISRIKEVCNYFIATRGEASQAVSNAIYQMIKGISIYTASHDIKAVANIIIDVKNTYLKKSKEAVEQTIRYAVEVGNRMQSILVYDYSSNVEAFLLALDKGKTIFIAESRVIDGGKPFVKACCERGHHIHFIPDASLMYYMKVCDGAFMGAETMYPDGTGFNTTGSDIVGLICSYHKIPLYFISPLIKLDIRFIYGQEKMIVMNDLYDKMNGIANPEHLECDIDYHCPELLGVCAEHIKAFITEQGVIPSTQLYTIALAYWKDLGGYEYV